MVQRLEAAPAGMAQGLSDLEDIAECIVYQPVAS